MIHPVSLVQAGMILVTVCIQTVGTKPENEYTVTGKLSKREVEVTLQVLPCGSFFRQDLVHGSLFRIVLFCGGTLAPVSYYNGSTLVEFPLCKADAPDDARYCIKNNLNTTAKGVQSFIVPAGVKLKIGTDELYPENITRRYDKFNPNPEPGKNGTDPLGPMANKSDLTGRHAQWLTIAVSVPLSAALLAAFTVAVVFIVLFCRKPKRNPQEEQGQLLAAFGSEESENYDLGRGRDLNRDLGPPRDANPLLSHSLSSGQQPSADSPSSGQQPSADSLSSGQQPSADSPSSGQQPSADSLSSGQQPSADSLSSGQQPSADSPSSGQQPSADSPSSGQQLSGSGQPSDEADRLPLQISQFGEESLLQEAAAAACRGQLLLRNTNQGNGGCVQDHTMKLPSQLPARR